MGSKFTKPEKDTYKALRAFLDLDGHKYDKISLKALAKWLKLHVDAIPEHLNFPQWDKLGDEIWKASRNGDTTAKDALLAWRLVLILLRKNHQATTSQGATDLQLPFPHPDGASSSSCDLNSVPCRAELDRGGSFARTCPGATTNLGSGGCTTDATRGLADSGGGAEQSRSDGPSLVGSGDGAGPSRGAGAVGAAMDSRCFLGAAAARGSSAATAPRGAGAKQAMAGVHGHAETRRGASPPSLMQHDVAAPWLAARAHSAERGCAANLAAMSGEGVRDWAPVGAAAPRLGASARGSELRRGADLALHGGDARGDMSFCDCGNECCGAAARQMQRRARRGRPGAPCAAESGEPGLAGGTAGAVAPPRGGCPGIQWLRELRSGLRSAEPRRRGRPRRGWCQRGGGRQLHTVLRAGPVPLQGRPCLEPAAHIPQPRGAGLQRRLPRL